MTSETSKISMIAARIRAVARVWSILVWLLALILIIGTRRGLTTGNPINDPLDILIPVTLFISLIGLGIAWRWEAWGVLINFGFFLAVLPIYWLLHGEWVHISIMVGLSPVVLPSVLFAAAWFLTRKEDHQP